MVLKADVTRDLWDYSDRPAKRSDNTLSHQVFVIPCSDWGGAVTIISAIYEAGRNKFGTIMHSQYATELSGIEYYRDIHPNHTNIDITFFLYQQLGFKFIERYLTPEAFREFLISKGLQAN